MYLLLLMIIPLCVSVCVSVTQYSHATTTNATIKFQFVRDKILVFNFTLFYMQNNRNLMVKIQTFKSLKFYVFEFVK